MKTKRINVRVAEKDKEALTKLSEELDIPESVIVREAVKDRIRKLQKQTEKQDFALAV